MFPYLLSFGALDARVSLQGEKVYGLRLGPLGPTNFLAMCEEHSVTHHKPYKYAGVLRCSRSAPRARAHQPT